MSSYRQHRLRLLAERERERQRQTPPPPKFPGLTPYYAAPTRTDLAVVLVYFNPASSIRIIQNLLTVRHHLAAAGIPYFIGEMAHKDAPFLFAPADNIFHVRSDSLMFYKENLQRYVVERLPASFTKLCFLDADILFKEPTWYDTISATLDTVDVCQPFTAAHGLTIGYDIEFSKQNNIDVSFNKIKENIHHPGYCWATTRAWYTAAAPSDFCVIGGGDVIFYTYVTKNLTLLRVPGREYYHFLESDIVRAPSASYTSCPLTIFHLNHGTLTNRQYATRGPSLSATIFALLGSPSIPAVLERRADGIFEWVPAVRDVLNAHVARFFAARNDDSNASGVIPTTTRVKFHPLHYEVPSATATRDMAVILVYFNAANYSRPIQNLLLVKHFLELANIPVFITELAINDAPFLFRGPADNLFQVRSSSAMFYKENLIRYTEARIPATFTKICLLDSDVLFDNPAWYSDISSVLDTATVVQPFRTAYWLDIDFTAVKAMNNGLLDPRSGHPGFAYAFDRAFFRRFQLEDRCVNATAGDTILRAHLLNRSLADSEPYFTLFPPLPDRSREGLRIGMVSFNAFHLNHGPLTKRNYFPITSLWLDLFRTRRITSIDSVIDRRDDGILEWKPAVRADFNARMITYFKSREEDSGLPEPTTTT